MNKFNRSLQICGAFLLMGFLFSCTRYKEVAYFQDVPGKDSAQVYQDGVWRTKQAFRSLKIRTGDILQISIQTIAPASDPTSGIASGTGFSLSDWQSSGQLGTQGMANSSGIPGYIVDNNGEIELPLVGKITVQGLTIPEIKEKVRLNAEKYYKDPVVNVRLANFKVTVLGEVARPGTYILDQEKSTLLDALGMAGDMTIFGKRTNVLLSRDVDGKEKLVRFDMNSTEVFDSPYFYLKQGDVIYVQPTKGKAASNDAAAARMYTVIASTVSLLVVIATRVKF
ncbi:MAG TPA: polysaccharide biosynthesis/export family protein [Edaphocola sp.]|nr:polysaccharide biosynthesis/export family protein [Edaphocola sp.]